MKADFVVHPDGTVGEVTVKGDASAGALAAVKRYVEACRYEPLEQDGKAMESRWHLDFELRK